MIQEKSKKLIVSGCCERPGGFELGPGKYYGKARLLSLDLETGQFDIRFEVSEGNENWPDEHPNLEFTAGCLEGDLLWQPADTEIYLLQLPDFNHLKTISHPCFNNIHSVAVRDDKLYVTSTGLDNVVILDKLSGEILDIINTEGKDCWHRFDPQVDYRKMHSTRPHAVHPNFVFFLDGEPWVTRCDLQDAVRIYDIRERIALTSPDEEISIHDGVRWGEQVVFTRVDGKLIFVEASSRKLVRELDPFREEKSRPRSWCRGLHIEGDICYIGFTRLRKTRAKTKLKYLLQQNMRSLLGYGALVVAYDLRQCKLLRIYEAPHDYIDAIYSLLPLPQGSG